MMAALRALVVEDSVTDAELMLHCLHDDGLVVEPIRVDTMAAYLEALDGSGRPDGPGEPFDLILADWALPGFTGLEALRALRDLGSDTPFIIVSGRIGEETAVDAMRQGADDYVLKDRMARLGPAVRRALDSKLMRDRNRAAERQIQRAQRMDVVGAIAAGVAHDFNNLLTVIGGYAQLLEFAGPDDEQQRQDLGQILRAVDRASTLARQLLTFARHEPVAFVPVDLGAVVDDIAGLLRRVLGEAIEIEADIEVGRWRIDGDVGRLEQVIMNLAVNARDAMPQGGRLSFVLGEVGEDGLAGTGHVELQVVDSGVGMTPELVEQAFQPFFTTKGTGFGTGLGLSTVYGIVRQHRGDVSVDSTPNRGTTFRLRFPLLDQPALIAAGVEAPVRAESSAAVLLVEDDPATRALLSQVVKRAGHDVVEVANLVGALGLAADPSVRIDVLLTDVVSASATGQEIADALRAWRPGLPLVLMSAYDAPRMPSGLAGAAVSVGPAWTIVSKHHIATQVDGQIRKVLGWAERSG